MEKYGEGAEARIYLGKVLGTRLVLKVRGRKRYRIDEIDLRIRQQRTRREAAILRRAFSIGLNAPRLVAVGRTSILMTFIEGTLLKDIQNPSEKTLGDAGRLLARMHSADIVHGDFTPANLIVGKKGAAVIDFGLASVSRSQEEKAIDLLLMKRAISGTKFSRIIAGYREGNPMSKTVVDRMAEVERRGRYHLRSLS